jgi:hypothetical protein
VKKFVILIAAARIRPVGSGKTNGDYKERAVADKNSGNAGSNIFVVGFVKHASLP